jgi:hypothetical protein
VAGEANFDENDFFPKSKFYLSAISSIKGYVSSGGLGSSKLG